MKRYILILALKSGLEHGVISGIIAFALSLLWHLIFPELTLTYVFALTAGIAIGNFLSGFIREIL